jgi:anthranilate synthase component 1
MLYRFIIAVNHLRNELTITENLTGNDRSRIDELISIIDNRNFPVYNFHASGNISSAITDCEYKEMVNRGIKHCLRGDVFQIVLSRRFEQPFIGDDFKVYRALRSINPSPYLFYFDFGSYRIFGSSPETHLKIQGNTATIDPIAGTFRRTGDDEKDRELARNLLNDPKENAEHVMLVDLARNDLSRNAKKVEVKSYKEIQFYSHVIHMVSRVSGEISPEANRIKVFGDTFPAGTLSGAPKIRAMQLINEIEKHSRGIYGGCIGQIGFDGSFNHAITIRSFVSRNNTLYFQAGAGIVAKSDPEKELEEVNSKLGALSQAIEIANGLKN